MKRFRIEYSIIAEGKEYPRIFEITATTEEKAIKQLNAHMRTDEIDKLTINNVELLPQI
ncbi:MAG: hypothetical protein WCY05_04170 [Candidatus Omnitrophota bacterium]